MKRRKKRKLILERNLITYLDQHSIVSEQFRTIRSNIKFVSLDKNIKTILVTSSVPEEGKSTIAANTAVVFALEGKRVLIIDADLRKPTLHYTFRVLNAMGLTSRLTSNIATKDVIQNTFIEGLSVMTSGKIPSNPAELISSQKMDEILSEVNEEFDLIIIDAPPILVVTDPQLLANKCDGTILVVETGKVDKKDVLKAKNTILAAKGKFLGVILNNYKLPTSNYYYYAEEK